MVNEVALGLLWVMFGWKIALLYIGSGLTVAIIGGYIIGKLKLEHLVQDYVYQIHLPEAAVNNELQQSFQDRVDYAVAYVKRILGKVWLYILLGVALGGLIHGYAPEDFLAKYAGRDNPFAVPVAVAIGVPLYSNAAGTIPIVNALMAKGMPLGTALAFMMAVTGLSLPEMIILKQVLKTKLIIIFVSIIAVAIMATGYLFNLIL